MPKHKERFIIDGKGTGESSSKRDAREETPGYRSN
jgi:hypothetical protein